MSRSMKPLRVLCSCVILLSLSADATAQEEVQVDEGTTNRQEAPVPDKLEAAISTLKIDEQLRLSITGSERIKGPYQGYGDDGVCLAADELQRCISASEVDALWVRGRATSTGAIVGALVGGIAGGIGGYGMSQNSFFNEPAAPPTPYIAAGAMLGACVGAGLGALVGTAFPKWHRKY